MAEHRSMGIGVLGAPELILKRKFRYTLKIQYECGGTTQYIPEHFVKIATRPQLDIDEVELNFLNGVTWVPGKGRWQPLTVTYVDVANHYANGFLFSWLATVYDFTQKNPVNHLPQSEKNGWNGTATLQMWDGCGSELEKWVLHSVWPQSINFGDLDYSNSEESTIELTLRYSEAQYSTECGLNPSGCCEGCDS